MPTSRTSGAASGIPFLGTVIAALLLLGVECYLHADDFLFRYRAVFAAGRVMDKLKAIEAAPPRRLVIGNSRVDNAVIPRLLAQRTGLATFNLGVPGAESCNLYGLISRLERQHLFGPEAISDVLLGIDETLLQSTTGLGLEVMFDDRARLLADGRYVDWAKSWLRLWGYADSLKTLQEPAKLLRFVSATFEPVEPWGGSARDNLGHRAADEVQTQDAAQIAQQEAASQAPPASTQVACLWALTDRLQRSQVNVRVFFPPTLQRVNSFEDDENDSARAYRVLRAQFSDRAIEVLALPITDLRKREYFANIGHLNRQGAERFTAILGEYLRSTASAAAN